MTRICGLSPLLATGTKRSGDFKEVKERITNIVNLRAFFQTEEKNGVEIC